MKIFIWENVEQLTCREHCDGGLVVIAENEERARELANEDKYCELQAEKKPDYVLEVVGGEEKVFIFQDAGCC